MSSVTTDAMPDTATLIAMIQSQKEIIDHQKRAVQSQGELIDKQNEIIKKLALDCQQIGKGSVKIARRVADREIAKFKHAYIQDVKELRARVQELDEQNKKMKMVAGVASVVAIGCLGVAVGPYVLVALAV